MTSRNRIGLDGSGDPGSNPATGYHSTTDGSESTMAKLYRIIWRDGRFDYYANKLNTVDSPPKVRWSTKADDPNPDWFTSEELFKILDFYSDQRFELEERIVDERHKWYKTE
jgi:hypothetical protein